MTAPSYYNTDFSIMWSESCLFLTDAVYSMILGNILSIHISHKTQSNIAHNAQGQGSTSSNMACM